MQHCFDIYIRTCSEYCTVRGQKGKHLQQSVEDRSRTVTSNSTTLRKLHKEKFTFLFHSIAFYSTHSFTAARTHTHLIKVNVLVLLTERRASTHTFVRKFQLTLFYAFNKNIFIHNINEKYKQIYVVTHTRPVTHMCHIRTYTQKREMNTSVYGNSMSNNTI